MPRQRIELAINGRFMHQPLTGVQRVARELTREIDQLVASTHQEFDVRLICPTGTDISDLGLTSIRVDYVAGSRNSLWEQVALPSAIGKAKLLCLGNTAPLVVLLFNRPVAIVIHDVSYRKFKDAYRLTYRLVHSVLLPLMLSRGNPIITVSNAESAVLTTIAPASADRIVVAQNGSWRRLHERSETLPATEERRYALFVGSLSQRKNFAGLLETAIRLAREHNIPFKFVGSVGKILVPTPVDIPSDVKDKIEFLGQIEDLHQLENIYRHARCLVFPSFYESSPLPPLEAMHFGCPVVASSIPAIIERCGNAAEYCDPTDIGSIVAAVRRITEDDAHAADLAARGLEWERNFSWRKQAATILDALRDTR